MLESRVTPRASCAAASRLASRYRMAVLPRPAGVGIATTPMYASSQLQQGSRGSRLAPSRFVPASCSGTGTGANSAPEGAARNATDLPQPADDENAAEGGGSSPKQPAGADARPADAKSSRQRQAAEAMLQEALRPLVETQAGLRALLEAAQLQRLELVELSEQLKGLAEQQLPPDHEQWQKLEEQIRKHQEQMRQYQEQMRQHREQQREQEEQLRRQYQEQVRQLEEQNEQQREQTELLRQLLLANNFETFGVRMPGQAIQVPEGQCVRQAPRLLDYVRIHEEQDGIVLGTANGGARVQVRCLTGVDVDHVYEDEVMEVIAECDLLSNSDRVQYLPYDPERKGVPVTRFTAAPGMLVRRGYDVKEGEEREAAAGEVGVLQPSPDMGDTCLVEWASAIQRVYETGWGDRFELVHMETSRTSGAPVVGEDWTDMDVEEHELLWEGEELQCPKHLSVSQVVGGTAVERGTHWVYGGAEPGVGSIYAAASGRQVDIEPGMVPVKWPNGQMLRHFASLVFGCDLCYSARPGDPVTLFTAREGLKVETTAAGGASVPGVLVRPERIRGHAVLWQVKLFRPPPNTVTYAVEASRSTPSSAPTESGSPDVAELRYI